MGAVESDRQEETVPSSDRLAMDSTVGRTRDDGHLHEVSDVIQVLLGVAAAESLQRRRAKRESRMLSLNGVMRFPTHRRREGGRLAAGRQAIDSGLQRDEHGVARLRVDGV